MKTLAKPTRLTYSGKAEKITAYADEVCEMATITKVCAAVLPIVAWAVPAAPPLVGAFAGSCAIHHLIFTYLCDGSL